MNKIMKQLKMTQELSCNPRYQKVIKNLEKLLKEIDVVGFSAYLENGSLKTSFYFNEEDLFIHTIKNRE